MTSTARREAGKMTTETGVLSDTKDLVPGQPVLDGHSCVEGIARACFPGLQNIYPDRVGRLDSLRR